MRKEKLRAIENFLQYRLDPPRDYVSEALVAWRSAYQSVIDEGIDKEQCLYIAAPFATIAGNEWPGEDPSSNDEEFDAKLKAAATEYARRLSQIADDSTTENTEGINGFTG